MKGVIAAAGHATRFLPWSSTLSKAMLPWGDKPIIAYQIDQLRHWGIEPLLIVVSSHMPEIKAYLDHNYPNEIIYYARQPDYLPYGDAAPILTARSWTGDEPFYALWCDDLTSWDFIRGMIAKYEDAGLSVLGTSHVLNPEDYGGVFYKGDRVLSVYQQGNNGTLAQMGHFVFTPEVFDYLDRVDRTWIGYALHEMAKDGRLLHCKCSHWWDLGDWNRYYYHLYRARCHDVLLTK